VRSRRTKSLLKADESGLKVGFNTHELLCGCSIKAIYVYIGVTCIDLKSAKA
jgi:hypothetical protein